MAKQDDYVRITIRVPKDVHAALSEKCLGEAHSLNAEIIKALQDRVLKIKQNEIKTRTIFELIGKDANSSFDEKDLDKAVEIVVNHHREIEQQNKQELTRLAQDIESLKQSLGLIKKRKRPS